MRMHELAHDNGTYACLVPDQATRSMLIGLQRLYNIPNPVPVDDLHMTVIYSRTPCPEVEQVAAQFGGLDGMLVKLGYLPTQGGSQALVAEIDSADAVALHHHIRETYGASHDYPSYLAHVTLSYDCPTSIRHLGEPHAVRFDELKVRGLDANWKADT